MNQRALIVIAVLAVASRAAAADTDTPKHSLPPARNGGTVIGMCDGKTSLEVADLKPGEKLSRSQAQAVSDQLMTEWRKKNPDARWDAPTQVAQAGPGPSGGARSPPAVPANQPKPSTPQMPSQQSATTGASQSRPGVQSNLQVGQTYGAFSTRDEVIWAESVKHFVGEGNRIFHDADELGGTVGISCDMCHPNAANTHPETYPKYQVQLGKVALLRDMINWCIENPVRGKPLKDDDPKLKALEAYILSERKGVPLEYGKH